LINDKIAVYTALFGNYDELKEPLEKYESCDFFCFTDNKNLKSNIWKIIYVKPFTKSNLMNRYYKLFPNFFLKDYEYSIYIDSNIQIIKNPSILISKYLKNDNSFLALPKHPYRDCFYDEIPLLIRAGRVSFFKIYKQIFYYAKKNYWGQVLLTENNIILRKHNDKKCITLMKQWWFHINKFTARDQISLGYIIYRNKIKIRYMKENSRDKQNFLIYSHKVSSSILKKILFNSGPYLLSLFLNMFFKKKCRIIRYYE
jgi:hypothetical protein